VPTPALLLVMCAGVVGSRVQQERADGFLVRLPVILAAAAGPGVLRPFGLCARGDEVEGALLPGADPFRPIVAAALDPDGLPLRWAVVAGEGKAARARAMAELVQLKARRERLVVLSGDPGTDALLADLAPLLDALVGDMTARQRDIARRILVEGRRQAAVAAELRVSRATVSVAVARGRVRDLERAMRGLHGLLMGGIAARGQMERGGTPTVFYALPTSIGSVAG